MAPGKVAEPDGRLGVGIFFLFALVSGLSMPGVAISFSMEAGFSRRETVVALVVTAMGATALYVIGMYRGFWQYLRKPGMRFNAYCSSVVVFMGSWFVLHDLGVEQGLLLSFAYAGSHHLVLSITMLVAGCPRGQRCMV